MKQLLFLGALIILFAACKKNHTPAPTTPANKIAGRWDIAYITTIFRDSLGVTIPGGVLVYPATAGMFYRFNEDNTWTEAGNPTGITSSGNYQLKSDKELVFTSPLTTGKKTECSISELSANRFVFSNQEPDLVNGKPGFTESIFELRR